MADNYNYETIDQKAKEMAVAELNENPSQINAHIESFRRWVTSMPHLKCPTDSNFLLKFLRVAKFDHKKAQQRLDNFCTIRCSPRGSPQYFKHVDINDPLIAEFMDSLILVPLGRNDAGELILLLRSRGWDPDKISLIQYTTMTFMVVDIIISEQETQIYGMKIFVDLEDVSKKAIAAWSDTKFLNQFNRAFNESYPMRMKGQIFYKEPVIFDIVLSIYTFFLNDKMKGRIVRVKDDLRKAIEKIPGFEKILPTEYGGKGGSLKSTAEEWKKKFKTYYKNGNPLSCISVDESKRPKETLGYLAEYKVYNGPSIGVEGTFTKYDNVF